MVQYAAGALRARKLVSIARLPELRRDRSVAGDEIQIGAGATYTDSAAAGCDRARISDAGASRRTGPAASPTRIAARLAGIS